MLGSIGEALFFSGLIGLGALTFWLLFRTLVVPDWRVNNEFVEHRCVVRDKHLVERPGDSGTQYRAEFQIEYQVSGITYSIWTYDLQREFSSSAARAHAVLNEFAVDRSYPCWYDPRDPSVAVLVRRHSWWTWLLFVVPASFVIIGVGGLAYRLMHLGASAERRAALARRAARPLHRLEPQRSVFPSVPDASIVTDSPGTVLAYRLPLKSSPGWYLFVLGVSCVGWNVILVIVAWAAVARAFDGRPEWWSLASLVPFVAIGVALIVYFIRQLLIANGIGPTLVEVSHHPLVPGGAYELAVSQSGRLQLRRFEVLLVSEEEATYRQGTDTRKENRRVFEQSLFARDDFEIPRGSPLEPRCNLEIPRDAMHSFKSEHNEVLWKIVVRGQLSNGLNYERSFPVIVYPARPQA